jgi:hypothetical protein
MLRLLRKLQGSGAIPDWSAHIVNLAGRCRPQAIAAIKSSPQNCAIVRMGKQRRLFKANRLQ